MCCAVLCCAVSVPNTPPGLRAPCPRPHSHPHPQETTTDHTHRQRERVHGMPAAPPSVGMVWPSLTLSAFDFSSFLTFASAAPPATPPDRQTDRQKHNTDTDTDAMANPPIPPPPAPCSFILTSSSGRSSGGRARRLIGRHEVAPAMTRQAPHSPQVRWRCEVGRCGGRGMEGSARPLWRLESWLLLLRHGRQLAHVLVAVAATQAAVGGAGL